MTDEQIQLYQQGLTLKEIASLYAINYNTLYKRARKAQREGRVQLRTPSQTLQLLWARGRKRYVKPHRYGQWVTCAYCGKKVFRRGCHLNSHRYFCSNRCRAAQCTQKEKCTSPYLAEVTVPVDQFRCFQAFGKRYFIGGPGRPPKTIRVCKLKNGQLRFYRSGTHPLTRPLYSDPVTAEVTVNRNRTFFFHCETWAFRRALPKKKIKCLYVNGEYRFWTTKFDKPLKAFPACYRWGLSQVTETLARILQGKPTRRPGYEKTLS